MCYGINIESVFSEHSLKVSCELLHFRLYCHFLPFKGINFARDGHNDRQNLFWNEWRFYSELFVNKIDLSSALFWPFCHHFPPLSMPVAHFPNIIIAI